MPPSTSVAALPPQVVDQFPVRWSGTDNAGGAVRFDVLISTDGAPLTPWLRNTTLTGALYPGERGHRYAFYTVGTDDTGNREAAPATADAVTSTSLENTPPTFPAPGTQVIDEGVEFALQLRATDTDQPPQSLTWSLGPGGPGGLVVDPNTGLLRWTTGEGNGPATNRVTVFVRDNGVPPRTVSQTFDLVVREVNQAPTVAPVADATVKEGQRLSFRVEANDSDLPAQTLTYALAAGSPAGATIDPVTGEFRWTPREFQGPKTYTLSVVVTDSGTPRIATTRSFPVVVRDALGDFRLGFGRTRVRAGSTGLVPVHLLSGADLTRLELTIESESPSLLDLRLEPLIPEIQSAFLEPVGGSRYRATFQAAPGAVLDGDRDVARLAFGSAPTNSASARLLPGNPTGLALDGFTTLRGTATPGRVLVIGSTPVLEAMGGARYLLHGEPLRRYLVETTPGLEPVPVPWAVLGTYTVSEQPVELTLAPGDDEAFLRAREVP